MPRVADAVITYTFNLKGNANVLSVNPLVGETNDGWLSDIRSRPITPEDVFTAINNATTGAVEEGAVGAEAPAPLLFSRFKGGIGTSSQRLPAALIGYTVGVLVQTNFGGNLIIMGHRSATNWEIFIPRFLPTKRKIPARLCRRRRWMAPA